MAYELLHVTTLPTRVFVVGIILFSPTGAAAALAAAIPSASYAPVVVCSEIQVHTAASETTLSTYPQHLKAPSFPQTISVHVAARVVVKYRSGPASFSSSTGSSAAHTGS